jgi:hypothetical protein
LLAALSLSWLYIAGLGALPAILLAGRSRPAGAGTPEERERSGFTLLAAVWSFGLCLNYLLALVLGGMAATLLLGSALALVLGGAALWLNRGWLAWPGPAAAGLVALAVLLVLAAAILLDPLHDWDARVIWFFHGKIVYFAGMLAPDSQLVFYTVPHPDYPKLLAVLAAETATMAGFWNEYLPKLGLVLLLPAPILALLTLRRRPWTLALGIFGFLAVPQQFLSNGSMDGYLALYAAVAALFLADWLEGGGDAALLAAAGALGVAGGLKLEGMIVYAALGLALAALVLPGRVRLPRPSGPALALLPLPFAGFVLWRAYVHLWPVPQEHFSPAKAWGRLFDGESVRLIVHQVLLDPRVIAPALILLAVAALTRWRGRRLPPAAWLPLLAGLLYLGATCAIFLMYPMGLALELSMAAGRVVRGGSALLLVASLVALRSLEVRPLGRAAGPAA